MRNLALGEGGGIVENNIVFNQRESIRIWSAMINCSYYIKQGDVSSNLFPISEYNMNDNHSFCGRKTSLHSSRHKFGRKNHHFEHPGYVLVSSRFQENSENMAIRDVQEDSRVT